MIQSITFGDKNTWDDWKILPVERPVFAPPKPKTTYIDIPGGNGALDLSESLTGYPVFENRTGSFKFRVINDEIDQILGETPSVIDKDWCERYTEIMEYLHGRVMNAVLADDPNFFYRGRFTVDGWESGDTWSIITIGYNVEPYKWSVISSVDPWYWDNFNFEKDIILSDSFIGITIDSPNEWTSDVFDGILFGKAPISPIFNVTNSSGLRVKMLNNSFGINEEVYLTDGRNVINDFIFYGQDSYTLEFKGIGTVSIEFRVGRL